MTNRKSLLLRSCAGAALALALTVDPRAAAAQAFQAIPDSVNGNVTFDRNVPGVDTITVDDLDAVITWVPFTDGQGNALTFLPNGNTAIFQGVPGATNFGVINRILPAPNANITVIDGAVISQLQDISLATSPGGFVAFYSSTGLLIGSNATFDVGGLLLTSIQPDSLAFQQFVTGTGSMNLNGVSNDSSLVQIDPGATITGTAEGSVFAVVAPQIVMSGTADINGSVAYVAAQDVTLGVSNGLFDIVIPTGTNVANAIYHDGTTTGPSSLGPGDNHVIYAVAQAQQNPINMLFLGNLGFLPAASASIQNGEIILSANYEVSGTQVLNDLTTASTKSDQQSDIFVQNATITSDISVHSSDYAVIAAGGGLSTITGNVFVYARNDAEVVSGADSVFNITGDVTVSASTIGNSIPSVSDPLLLNANGGVALVGADSAGSLTITGDVFISANATPGDDSAALIFGDAVAGSAELYSDSADVQINGSVFLDANALGPQRPGNFNSGGGGSGGLAYIDAQNFGTLTITGDASASASGNAATLLGTGDSNPVGDGIGGTVQVFVGGLSNGSSLQIGGNATLIANGAGAASASPVGGNGLGGTVSLSSLIDGPGVTITGTTLMTADGFGGDAVNGTGGIGFGGQATVAASSQGNLTLNNELTIQANSTGGTGVTGGEARGGNSGINLSSGAVVSLTDVIMDATTTGGDATNGVAGDGRSGLVSVIATGGSSLTINSSLSASTLSFGGNATGGDGGRSRNATEFENILITADNSTIDASLATVDISLGGAGGNTQSSGFSGGDATAGASLVDARNGGDITMNTVTTTIEAFGGSGPFAQGNTALGGSAHFRATGTGSTLDVLNGFLVTTSAIGGDTNGGTGIGGLAEGGSATVEAVNAGALNLSDTIPSLISISATGGGSNVDGGSGGNAVGGDVTLQATSGGTLGAGVISLSNLTSGGDSINSGFNITGGNVTAGTGSVVFAGPSSLLDGEISLSDSALGGEGSGTAAGGNATSGAVRFTANGGTIDLLGTSIARSLAVGGDGDTGGTATAGLAAGLGQNLGTVQILDGTSLTFESTALGGTGVTQGGNAIAGNADVQIDNASLLGGDLTILSSATAGADTGGFSGGGSAVAGGASLTASNAATVDLIHLSLTSNATTAPDGSAIGGVVQVQANGIGTVIGSALIDFETSAFGGTSSSSGTFFLDALSGGVISADDFVADALTSVGLGSSGQSGLSAQNGQIQILNTAVINANGPLLFQTTTGGLIVGGTSPSSLSASFDFTSSGLITISGDSDVTPTFGSLSLSFTSNDIDILPNTSFGAPTLSFTSTNTSSSAIIGGTISGPGYTITQAESEAIEGDNISFFGAATTGGDTYDVQLRDLTILGSLDSGISSLSIFSDGSMGIVGALHYTSADFTDQLNLYALGELTIELPTGSITMDNGAVSGFAYTGTVYMFGEQLFAATGDVLPGIRANPDDPALALVLGDDGGASVVTNYLSANTVSLEADSHILMQNTGAAGTLGGILVGPGGLTIRQFSDSMATTMRTIAYGMQDLGSGTLVTNDDFFALVDFGTDVVNEFTPGSTFNDCDIVNNSCVAPPPPPPPPPVVTPPPPPPPVV
ncbi:hypothetical protein GRI32_09895, partial [Altererythrobacter aestuarii]